MTYTFACPVCRKRFRSDEPGEPCCTGPNEATDDHELTVMRLIRIDRRDIGPQYAAGRAKGVLMIPGVTDNVIDGELLRARP